MLLLTALKPCCMLLHKTDSFLSVVTPDQIALLNCAWGWFLLLMWVQAQPPGKHVTLTCVNVLCCVWCAAAGSIPFTCTLVGLNDRPA
jgi:hypothetical protein